MKKNKNPLKEQKASEDKTLKVYQRSKIEIQLKIAQPIWSEKQGEYIDLVRHKDSKIILLTGPAGSSKSFINMWIALELLNIGRIQEIICVRSVVESSSIGLGYLPGSVGEKLQPYAEPFLDKLRQLLPQTQIDALMKDNRIQFMPVNYLRGREFNASFIFVDEAQNLVEDEINTAMTRFGKYSKMVISGDYLQSDLETFRKMKSGLKPTFDLYDDDESHKQGISCFKFGIEDIKREDIIKFIVERFQKHKESPKGINK